MEGYQVTKTMDEAAPVGDIFVTATGQHRRHHAGHMRGCMTAQSSATSAISTAEIQVAR